MHPILWACDTAAAARAVAQHFPQAAQAAVARADDICRQTFVFQDTWEMERTHEPVHFPGAIDWDYTPNGDPEWTYALNRHTTFVNLGKAWRYTGRAAYAEAFAAQMTDWLNRVPHTPASEETTWRALEAGLRCENWLRALRLLDGAPALTSALRADIDESLREHGRYLVKAHGPFQKLSNWGVLQDHGLFLLGVYFGRRDWADLALHRLTENLANALLADGVHWEQSPMYHCEVLRAVADTLLNARRNGVPAPDALERDIHRMFAALAQWVKPNGHLLCQSDSDDIDARGLLTEGTLLFEDGFLRAAAGPDSVSEEVIWDFGPDAIARYAAIDPQSDTVASAALAASGNYMLRADGTPASAYLHLHGGSLGGGHGHADLLHIDLGCGGEDILLDAGRFTYRESQARRLLKSPAAHNTLRLDGWDFTTYVDTWGWAEPADPLPGEFCLLPEADYLCAGHLGYGAPMQRKIVYLKPDIFVLADLFRGNGTHTIEQDFHFGPGELRLEEGAVFWQGLKTCAEFRFLYGPHMTRRESAYSPVYNQLFTAPALTLETPVEGVCPLMTVISLGGRCTAELLTVRNPAGQILAPAAAQAVRILKDGRIFTVLLTHTAGPHGSVLLQAGGCTGFGRALAFTPACPQGICLAR